MTLPNFNGAGLYDSYTHQPEEGHLSKSIQQVFASLWNLRAFEERDFYRIDHFAAAMGVLLHRNFEDEDANGVAVSRNILFGANDGPSNGIYYVNAQFGENLVTNPEDNAIPEQILISASNDPIYLSSSNLDGGRERVLNAFQSRTLTIAFASFILTGRLL
jgi:pyruvate, water dikinase